MQTRTFTVSIPDSIEITELRRSILRLSLGTGTDSFYGLPISVTHASVRNTVPLSVVTPTAPIILELVNITSSEILISLNWETGGKSLQGLTLNFISLTEFENTPTVPMDNVYRPLHNYYDGTGSLQDDLNFNTPFRTKKLAINNSSVVDLQLQLSYDRSINMIFSDDHNPVRLVNSRFRTNENVTEATIAERRTKKDTNTYSDEAFHRTELIPRYSGVPKLEYLGTSSGGSLVSGGYRYYFRYITADGAETDVIEESRLVEVHYGNNPRNSQSGMVGDTIPKTVKFKLSNLDTSFYGVRVYYTHTSGQSGAIPRSWKILNPFDVQSNGQIEIAHSGYEQIEEIANENIAIAYSTIATSKTVAASNDRLLMGNSEMSSVYDTELASLASRSTITEGNFTISQGKSMASEINDNYSNDKFTYDRLGYWRGETYELGVVYITDEGLSPVYTLQGIDNFDGDASYDSLYLGSTGKDFKPSGQNSLGIYRTSDDMDEFWTFLNSIRMHFKGIKLQVNPVPLIGYPDKYDSYSITEDDGLTMLHHKTKNEYYLVGTVSKTVLQGTDRYYIDNIPLSDDPIWFTFTNISGLPGKLLLKPRTRYLDVVDNPIEENTNLTNQTGPKPVVDDIKGFFLVRRKRKLDKLMQGIITAAAAVPTSTSYISDQVVAIPGNWTGVGTKSDVLGDNVTYVPAPFCMSPWGTEQVEIGSKFVEYDGDEDVEVGIPKGSLDFIQRAPILDYEDMKSWAFYSPDVDCNTTESATKFTGSKSGIRVRTTPFDIDFEYARNPARYNSALIRTLRIDSPYDTSVENGTETSEAEISYVETGSKKHGDRSFSAKCDRNIAMYLHLDVKDPRFTFYMTTGEKTNNPFYDPESTADPYGGDNHRWFRPVTVGVPTDYDADAKPSEDIKNDSDVDEARTPTVGVNYGRYLGVHAPDMFNLALDSLNMEVELYTGGGLPYNPGSNTNIQTTLTGDNIQGIANEEGNYYAFISEIYENTSGTPLNISNWITKYSSDEDTEYVAISRRYSVEEFDVQSGLLDVYGGDCYIGMQWKQAWSPLGIPEAPQVDDMDPYRADRKAVGLLSYGLAIPVPTQANNNFFVRMPERYSSTEYKVYGEDRLYLPVRSSVRGARQVETGMYDRGISLTGTSNNKLFRLNVNFPYVEESYPNRVYASEPAIGSGFLNGFTAFQGLNYKDYNSEYGPLTKIKLVNNSTFLVFYGGIATIGVSERSMVSQDTGGVFIDNADVLAKRSFTISNEYGSQHLHSIVSSTNFLYGVDFTRRRIWRTNGKALELISFFKVQKKLEQILTEMDAELAKNSGNWIDIISNYDISKGDVYFNFVVHYADDNTKSFSRTLVYSELANIWITETDDSRSFLMNVKGDKIAFGIKENQNTFYKYIKENLDEQGRFYNKFFGTVYPTEIGFNVISEATESKIFENLYITGNKTVPTNVVYSTDKIRDPKSQVLHPMSNITYVVSGVSLDGVEGEYKFTSTLVDFTNWNGEPFGEGDFFSVYNDAGDLNRYTCMRVDLDTKEIWVDIPLEGTFTNKIMLFGYPGEMRSSNAIYEDGYTKIVCSLDPNGLSSEYRPYGKWADMTLKYDGMAPMYLDSVLTIYNVNSS